MSKLKINNFGRTSELGRFFNLPIADPNTDFARFQKACFEADAFAKSSNFDVIVFKNNWGFYMVREAMFVQPGILTPLYFAFAKFNATKGSIAKVAWKSHPNRKNR